MSHRGRAASFVYFCVTFKSLKPRRDTDPKTPDSPRPPYRDPSVVIKALKINPARFFQSPNTPAQYFPPLLPQFFPTPFGRPLALTTPFPFLLFALSALTASLSTKSCIISCNWGFRRDMRRTSSVWMVERPAWCAKDSRSVATFSARAVS
jgi:hypothetical protein